MYNPTGYSIIGLTKKKLGHTDDPRVDSLNVLFNREMYFGSGRIQSYLYIPHSLTIMSLDTYLLYILRDHIRRCERRVLEVKLCNSL